MMIDFKLIDDSEELNLQLLDDNEEIKLEMTDYDDTEVKEMIDEVDNRVDNLSAQVNQEINDIEDDIDELDGRIRINTNNISNLQQTKADKSQVNALSTQVQANTTQIGQNKADITSLSNRVDQIPIITKTSQLTNDSGFITKDVNNLTYYTTTANLSKVALTGSYNDLSNKPSEVTESTVSNWGFTKNTGTYSKPSGGIPSTDLSSAVQTSLGKADTAIQSISSSDVTSALGYTPYNSTNPNGYTSNVGTITGITMNGASKGTSGIVDLGTVITSHQDISGKANKISVVQTSASTIEINPNTFYKFGEVASLNITLASITDNTIYNEYMFEFVSGTTATTLTLPSSIKWLETPTIDANKIYQCSIVDNVGLLVGVANV